MNKLILIGILAFNVLSCQNKEKNNIRHTIKKNDTMNEQPIYTLRISTANPHEIYVNNMPLERDYSSGSSTVELHINNFILKSGIQSIAIVLLPENGKVLVDKLGIDYFDVKIYKYPNGLLNMSPEDRILIKEFTLKEFGESPLVSKEISFEAIVPYKVEGWSGSVDLSKENLDNLISETVKTYNDFGNLLKEKDYKVFFDKTRNRDKETDIDLYLTSEQIDDNRIETINTFKKIVDVIPLEKYKMRFYGNGKIVALVRIDKDFNGESALQAVLKDESTQIFELLLHRPKPGAPLQVIR
ncbi:hypothetical protein SD960_08085 [Flavobacterium sp. MMLR14_040]|uniref:hypothetical protein n=1 Tax=Flavobacterium sp. MMLR14_040 TaxID=3093843 RepID=UPI00298FF788|nr:hypothetical protein [Flavobacterium sp. MMLR14_040]MDW8850046.1 hypothetical protein [Flavobacterium sp. MMLR14_040]